MNFDLKNGLLINEEIDNNFSSFFFDWLNYLFLTRAQILIPLININNNNNITCTNATL